MTQAKTTISNFGKRVPQKWRVLISVTFGLFMVILDTTVVNVAFQTLRTEFNASLNDSQWIISIYVLALGISTPLAGYLSDLLGMKRTYLMGLIIFIIGSLLCGLAPTLGLMIVARAIQGIGGGIAVPLSSAFILRTFPTEEQGTAIGIFGVVAISAPALGPILGGFLVDHNLWRLIFFINPPIGAIGVLLGLRFLPAFKSDHHPALDVVGLITEIIGFGAVLYAASVAANQGWSNPEVYVWLGIGAAGLAAFAINELFFAKEPLLDLRLFQKRTFLNASLLGYVSVIALFGAEFLMPIYLQALRGKTAFQTGLILLPMAVAAAISTTISGRLYDRIGPRLLVGTGFAILMINTWQLSQIRADTPIEAIMALLALRGLSIGLVVQPTFITALSVVPLPIIPKGSSLTNATRQVVQSLGVAILAAVLASSLSPQIAALQQQMLEAPRAANAAPVALCAPNAATIPLTGNADPPAQAGTLPPNLSGLLSQACSQNITGFERAYQITFFAAGLALLLGLMLPGWPLKWAGRRAADRPPEAA